MRALLLAQVLFVAALGAGASISTASQPGFNRLVCHNPSQTASTDPTFTTSTRAQRLVLGRVWLPKASTLLGWPAKPNTNGRDRFVKYGVVVTAGSPVTLVVPPSAQKIYALDFNNPAPTVAASKTKLLITPCPKKDGAATAWPGGYLLKHPACMPLIIRVRSRTARVRLALGHSC